MPNRSLKRTIFIASAQNGRLARALDGCEAKDEGVLVVQDRFNYVRDACVFALVM
jgi:hypothetical protein